MKKNEINLGFGIYGFEDIDHSYITNLLGLQPDYVRTKGEKKNPRNSDSPLIEVNKWMITSGIDPHLDFDQHLNALLDILEPRIDVLRPICERYDCEISCGMFVYFDNGESTPWVHLDDRYNKMTAQLKIEFDLDLYVMPISNPPRRTGTAPGHFP
ncbi:hypothetical protein DJ568_07345 [Mucilaginibacter hurinus]|uniref:DUF4279 domain-containing protein n=1 Tax=Mucilaginibacter hurinus TaxID=2201324 RepID=A0A367GSK4_9SPHI|nr:DUF4279 domain-containing protein [Mucilaginibacter hurinus]RCH55693.1 hypothetical protein DJ568_07345 [Mucilaginibacter hurinus]